MSNFLVVSSSNDRSAERIFSAGVRATRRIKQQAASSIVSAIGSRGGTFARRNGSGTRAVKDEATGVWLIATGTWFHDDGYATGSERKLLQRWLAAGSRALAREMEGSFTVVVSDPRARETTAITDLSGSSMTFFRAFDDAVAIGGSSSVLAALAACTTDALACQELLRTGIVFEDRTTWNEVRRASAASIYRFRDGSLISREQYWSPADVQPESLDGIEAVDALHDVLVRAARRIRGVYPKVACDLTGGYDSRALLTGFLSAQVPFSTTVTGTADSVDVVVAGRIAKELGLRHELLPPKLPRSFEEVSAAATLADFEYDPVEYSAIHAVHSHLSRHHDASVNGSAGELARGELWQNHTSPIGRRGAWDSGKLRRRRYLDSGCNPELFPSASRYDGFDYFGPMISRVAETVADQPNTNQIDWVYLAIRMHGWQARIATSTDQVWPCMSPFAFRSVIETCMRMSARSRMGSWAVKSMFHRHQPRAGRMPLVTGVPPLPMRVDTAHRLLWPVATNYPKLAWRKLKRTVTGAPWAAPATLDGVAPRVHLWMDQSVRSLLDPREMTTAALFEPGMLEGFLRESQSRDFAFGGQWNRLLGLEHGRRVVDAVRREVGGQRSVEAPDASDRVWSSQRSASAK